MACLVAKIVHGHRYWQIVTSQRVDGRPRQVVLAHLGTADRLLARLAEGLGQPIKARVREFGFLAAAWQLAADLGIAEIIDRHVPKRDQGPSVGKYLLLAALNRLARPTSKSKFAAWYAQTALRRWMPVRRSALASQRFWDHMDAVTEDAIRKIEADLSKRIVERFNIDLRCLCFDCTNFDTFVDSRNPAKLPQRGHAKSKRTDLRVVGLALLVSTDFRIPLFSHVYPGNQPDSVTFGSVTETLVARYRALTREVDHVTLVLDKGNNSAENLDQIAQSPFHVVGSLVPSQHSELLAVPAAKFVRQTDPRLGGVSAYRMTKEVYGHTWTIIVTRSKTLLDGQLRGIAQHLAKRRRALADLARRLERSQRPGAKGKGFTRESLAKQVERLTSGQYIRQILIVTVRERRGKLSLRFSTNRKALNDLQRRVLGKRILFTDNHDWPTDEIILAYRSQHHVEAAFRQMKDSGSISWCPVLHWTDQKIRVHTFYCVLALTLMNLIFREAWRAGVRATPNRVAEELRGIREVVNVYPSGSDGKGGRPRAVVTYTEESPLACQLAKLFRLRELRSR